MISDAIFIMEEGEIKHIDEILRKDLGGRKAVGSLHISTIIFSCLF